MLRAESTGLSCCQGGSTGWAVCRCVPAVQRYIAHNHRGKALHGRPKLGKGYFAAFMVSVASSGTALCPVLLLQGVMYTWL
jgi:hypothetical protein